MPMHVGSNSFEERLQNGLSDSFMRGAVSAAQDRLETARKNATDELGEWEECR